MNPLAQAPFKIQLTIGSTSSKASRVTAGGGSQPPRASNLHGIPALI